MQGFHSSTRFARANCAKLLVLLASTVGILPVLGKPAKAASFTALNQGTIANVFAECLNDGITIAIGQNPADDSNWYNAMDSAQDGVDGSLVGGANNRYEFYSLSLRETNNSIWVAINGNMPLTGIDGTAADDGNIGFGDLFFNFTGSDFTTASSVGSLFGVRFASSNDSPVSDVGLYGSVTPISTTNINAGFASLEDYNQHVITYGCTGLGCEPSLGDLPANTPYFDQTQSLNAIGSGDYLSDILYLSDSELIESGYDLNQVEGNHTIAFKFDKSAICDRGYCQQSVPEPSAALGLAALGLVAVGRQLRQRLF